MATRVQPEISTDQPGKATFPPGMANAFVFATFNALSFQIVLGSPMVLYARSLEASATVLGIIASCTAMMLSAFCLGQHSQPWQFALLFGFSGVAGVISLSFLKKIPDAEPPERQVTSSQPVPWLEIARYRPFRKLLRMNTAWAVAYGGLGAFTVAYLKTEAAMSESGILFVTGMAFLGGLCGLAYFGSRTDRLGSKPVLGFCLSIWIVIFIGWLLLAGRVVHPQFGLVLFLELLMGFAYALVIMNNTRLAMVLAPVMGRSHFFALYSVVANLTLGLAPMFWGLLIDAFGPRQIQWRHFELNRFSLFFGCVVGVFALALAFCRKLDEPKAADLG